MNTTKPTKYLTINVDYSKTYNLHHNNPNWLEEVGACGVSFTQPGCIATIVVKNFKKFLFAKVKYGL